MSAATNKMAIHDLMNLGNSCFFPEVIITVCAGLKSQAMSMAMGPNMAPKIMAIGSFKFRRAPILTVAIIEENHRKINALINAD